MSRRNNVRGPTSALTEFLRDSGITPTTIARRVATREQEDEQPVAGPSNAPTTPNISSRRRRATRTSGFASDELDEPEAEAPRNDAMDVDCEEEGEKASPKKKKQKLSKAAEAKLKAKEKKKRGKKDTDDEDEDDDAYTKISRSLWANNTPKPPVGSFDKCAVCQNQFTVTKYTMASNDASGWMCHACAKAGGKDPFKKPAVPKKRTNAAERRPVIQFQEKRFPSLVTLCVQVITQHIDDVDALGDIGTMNVEAIAKALSKTRSLTPENAHLFYNSQNESLTLFDATNLNSPALETLAYLNANLVSLRLDFCGQLNDESMKVWTTSLPLLERIELLGPFLVRSPTWQDFLKAHPNLESFLITQSPRFDLDCMKTLVSKCRGIKELRLREVGKLDDSFLLELKKVKSSLRLLDLSDPSKSCSEAAMIKLLSAVGSSLEHLSLSKHDELTGKFLEKGLQAHVTQLQSLTLAYIPELTDEGVAKFFEEWKNPPLVSLDLSRNHELKGPALKAVLEHSGERLEHLNINGWKEVPEADLKFIGRLCVELKKLDVGWCREVDDFLLLAWLNGEKVKGATKGGCKRLEEVKVWGCNKVSAACPRKKGVVIMGVESHTVA